MEEIKWEIPSKSGDPIELTLNSNNPLFIVGPNGSGKSALIQRFVREKSPSRGNRIKWIAAHRQTWFDSERINLTPERRERYERDTREYNRRNDARWKDFRAGQDLFAIQFDLVGKENTINKSIVSHVRNQDVVQALEFAADSPSLFDQINELLALGTLTITLENADDWSILATHPQGQSFSIAEMSDGERNAAIIAAHVITAEPGTVLLIDEPERHLHRSIMQPFLSALFALRREDCAFIIATHELALPVANSDAQVLMLRSCQWSGGECVAWNAQVLKPDSEQPRALTLPSDLKFAVLGSRQRILFVEGRSDSLDFPLYTALFPGLDVVSKGNCADVQKAVLGLRGSQDLHHVKAFGLIDRDNLTKEKIKELAEKGVFALEVSAVEALYYCSDTITAVAKRQAESLGVDAAELIKAAMQKAFDALRNQDLAQRMAALRCERQARELFLSKIPNWKSIRSNPTQPICVSIDSLYYEELNRFNELVEEEDLDQLVARYPLDSSPAFDEIARALRYRDRNDYQRRVITLIRSDDQLAHALKSRIGQLSEALDLEENPQTDAL